MQDSTGSTFLNRSYGVQATYAAGSVITATMVLTANHAGRIGAPAGPLAGAPALRGAAEGGLLVATCSRKNAHTAATPHQPRLGIHAA